MDSSTASAPFFGIRDEEPHNQQSLTPSSSTAAAAAAAASLPESAAPVKKRRNLPGNPNPDAEVIALSPKTLMATNRFVCEVCNKGFQREQNLQLHRRGHNLPWKLRQKSDKDKARRRVYLCPEPTCVHHDPSRALGDLTGIKKHFSRKHGEKKWKCDKCSKRYASTPTSRPTPRPAAPASTAATAAPSSPGEIASSLTAPSATRSRKRARGFRTASTPPWGATSTATAPWR
uniref:C2H2-type domain-containing protein n=1 Tax=Ananas comosus var. bracteatus TaxID=296719 RepID=A0A6V7QNC0_ANACO|nr:unnamed protein product [Ananas comosus var. bracteatus]